MTKIKKNNTTAELLLLAIAVAALASDRANAQTACSSNLDCLFSEYCSTTENICKPVSCFADVIANLDPDTGTYVCRCPSNATCGKFGCNYPTCSFVNGRVCEPILPTPTGCCHNNYECPMLINKNRYCNTMFGSCQYVDLARLPTYCINNDDCTDPEFPRCGLIFSRNPDSPKMCLRTLSGYAIPRPCNYHTDCIDLSIYPYQAVCQPGVAAPGYVGYCTVSLGALSIDWNTLVQYAPEVPCTSTGCSADIMKYDMITSPGISQAPECVTESGLCDVHVTQTFDAVTMCTLPSDCGDGNLCTADGCLAATAFLDFPTGKFCINRNLCSADELCSPTGTCVKCLNDGNCAPGEYCSPTGTCVECLNDGNCAPGEYCSPTGTCVECLNDGNCATDEYCGNGICNLAEYADCNIVYNTATDKYECIACTDADNDCWLGLNCVESACEGGVCVAVSPLPYGCCATADNCPTIPHKRAICSRVMGVCQYFDVAKPPIICNASNPCTDSEYPTCSPLFQYGSTSVCITLDEYYNAPRPCNAHSDCYDLSAYPYQSYCDYSYGITVGYSGYCFVEVNPLPTDRSWWTEDPVLSGGIPCTSNSGCTYTYPFLTSPGVSQEAYCAEHGYCDVRVTQTFDVVKQCTIPINSNSVECDDGNACTSDSCWKTEYFPGYPEGKMCVNRDLCAAEQTCNPSIGCVNTPSGCTQDSDCDDYDDHTRNVCRPCDGVCEYVPINPAEFCVPGIDSCNDGKDCTLDYCRDNVCVHEVTSDCCETDEDCPVSICGERVCNSGVCSESGCYPNTCGVRQSSGDLCCDTDRYCNEHYGPEYWCNNNVCELGTESAQCCDPYGPTCSALGGKNGWCADYWCDETTLTCVSEGPTPPECWCDAQCAAGYYCNYDTKECVFGVPQCDIADDCDDSDPCTYDYCENRVCGNDPVSDNPLDDMCCENIESGGVDDCCINGVDECGIWYDCVVPIYDAYLGEWTYIPKPGCTPCPADMINIGDKYEPNCVVCSSELGGCDTDFHCKTGDCAEDGTCEPTNGDAGCCKTDEDCEWNAPPCTHGLCHKQMGICQYYNDSAVLPECTTNEDCDFPLICSIDAVSFGKCVVDPGIGGIYYPRLCHSHYECSDLSIYPYIAVCETQGTLSEPGSCLMYYEPLAIHSDWIGETCAGCANDWDCYGFSNIDYVFNTNLEQNYYCNVDGYCVVEVTDPVGVTYCTDNSECGGEKIGDCPETYCNLQDYFEFGGYCIPFSNCGEGYMCAADHTCQPCALNTIPTGSYGTYDCMECSDEFGFMCSSKTGFGTWCGHTTCDSGACVEHDDPSCSSNTECAKTHVCDCDLQCKTDSLGRTCCSSGFGACAIDLSCCDGIRGCTNKYGDPCFVSGVCSSADPWVQGTCTNTYLPDCCSEHHQCINDMCYTRDCRGGHCIGTPTTTIPCTAGTHPDCSPSTGWTCVRDIHTGSCTANTECYDGNTHTRDVCDACTETCIFIPIITGYCTSTSDCTAANGGSCQDNLCYYSLSAGAIGSHSNPPHEDIPCVSDSQCATFNADLQCVEGACVALYIPNPCCTLYKDCDYLYYTDACNDHDCDIPSGHCTSTPPTLTPPDCYCDTDCEDGDTCTTNLCMTSRFGSIACDAGTYIPDCCNDLHQICGAGYECDDVTHTCQPTTECTLDSDCDDENTHTRDMCRLCDGTCEHVPISDDSYCDDSSQCIDDYGCTDDTCYDHICNNIPIENCCQNDGDCPWNSCATATCATATDKSGETTTRCARELSENLLCCEQDQECVGIFGKEFWCDDGTCALAPSIDEVCCATNPITGRVAAEDSSQVRGCLYYVALSGGCTPYGCSETGVCELRTITYPRCICDDNCLSGEECDAATHRCVPIPITLECPVDAIEVTIEPADPVCLACDPASADTPYQCDANIGCKAWSCAGDGSCALADEPVPGCCVEDYDCPGVPCMTPKCDKQLGVCQYKDELKEEISCAVDTECPEPLVCSTELGAEGTCQIMHDMSEWLTAQPQAWEYYPRECMSHRDCMDLSIWPAMAYCYFAEDGSANPTIPGICIVDYFRPLYFTALEICDHVCTDSSECTWRYPISYPESVTQTSACETFSSGDFCRVTVTDDVASLACSDTSCPTYDAYCLMDYCRTDVYQTYDGSALSMCTTMDLCTAPQFCDSVLGDCNECGTRLIIPLEDGTVTCGGCTLDSDCGDGLVCTETGDCTCNVATDCPRYDDGSVCWVFGPLCTCIDDADCNKVGDGSRVCLSGGECSCTSDEQCDDGSWMTLDYCNPNVDQQTGYRKCNYMISDWPCQEHNNTPCEETEPDSWCLDTLQCSCGGDITCADGEYCEWTSGYCLPNIDCTADSECQNVFNDYVATCHGGWCVMPAVRCDVDSDCEDWNTHTRDVCDACTSKCLNIPIITGYCESDPECTADTGGWCAGNMCHYRAASVIMPGPVPPHTPIPCLTDSWCIRYNADLQCVNGECVSYDVPVPCCTNDDDCHYLYTTDACYDHFCDVSLGHCDSTTPDLTYPNCYCNTDCRSDDTCMLSECVSGWFGGPTCQDTYIPGCCNSLHQICGAGEECDDVTHTCESVTTCTLDSDCADENTHTRDICRPCDGICEHIPISDGSYCDLDEQCADNSDCTLDTCVDHTCRNDFILDCCVLGTGTETGCPDSSCYSFACVLNEGGTTCVPGEGTPADDYLCCEHDSDCTRLYGDEFWCDAGVCSTPASEICCQEYSAEYPHFPCAYDSARSNGCEYYTCGSSATCELMYPIYPSCACSSTCHSGEECKSGTCTPITTCTTNSDCDGYPGTCTDLVLCLDYECKTVHTELQICCNIDDDCYQGRHECAEYTCDLDGHVCVAHDYVPYPGLECCEAHDECEQYYPDPWCVPYCPPYAQCSYEIAAGYECCDDYDCGAKHICTEGFCEAVECTSQYHCNDNNPCTNNVCTDNVCTYPNSPASTSCPDTDGTLCTSSAICNGLGSCVPVAAQAGTSCDDDNDGCTVGTCDGHGICTETPKCDDSNSCTENICDPVDYTCTNPPLTTGGCCAIAANCADDGNPCTEEICRDFTCVHQNSPRDTECPDFNGVACLDRYHCDGAGKCVASGAYPSTPCDYDNDLCTTGHCNGAGSCIEPPKCNDLNECTANDCSGGDCTYPPYHTGDCCETAADCTSHSDCYTATCDSEYTCQYAIKSYPCCDENSDCSDGDVCSLDVCGAGDRCTNPIDTTKDGTKCRESDDGCEWYTCTGGKCTEYYQNDGYGCNTDGKWCTEGKCDGSGTCFDNSTYARVCPGDATNCKRGYCDENMDQCKLADSWCPEDDLSCSFGCTDPNCAFRFLFYTACSGAQCSAYYNDLVQAGWGLPNNYGGTSAYFARTGGACTDKTECTEYPFSEPQCSSFGKICVYYLPIEYANCVLEYNDPLTGVAVSIDSCTKFPELATDDYCSVLECQADSIGRGICVESQRTCDDENACTVDCCDEIGNGCSNTADPDMIGQPCDSDDNSCTTQTCGSTGTCNVEYTHAGERCDDGDGKCIDHYVWSSTCTCTVPVRATEGTACDSDSNECTDDVCDDSGLCTHPNKPYYTKCYSNTKNGVECWEGYCSNGFCEDGFVVKDDPCTSDGNVCTKDVCDGLGHCGYPTNIGGSCNDDGLWCTVEACDDTGKCVYQHDQTCDDDYLNCKRGYCDRTSDACTLVDMDCPEDDPYCTTAVPRAGNCYSRPATIQSWDAGTCTSFAVAPPTTEIVWSPSYDINVIYWRAVESVCATAGDCRYPAVAICDSLHRCVYSITDTVTFSGEHVMFNKKSVDGRVTSTDLTASMLTHESGYCHEKTYAYLTTPNVWPTLFYSPISSVCSGDNDECTVECCDEIADKCQEYVKPGCCVIGELCTGTPDPCIEKYKYVDEMCTCMPVYWDETHVCDESDDVCIEDYKCNDQHECMPAYRPENYVCGPQDDLCVKDHECTAEHTCEPVYRDPGYICGSVYECSDNECNAAHECRSVPFPSTTDCSEKDTTICTDYHCDGSGECRAFSNNEGAHCEDPDSTICTDYMCRSGVCTKEHHHEGGYCEDPDSTVCTQYKCAGDYCQRYNQPLGLPCEADSSICTRDLCNGYGVCDHTSMSCGDSKICTWDACIPYNNTCAHGSIFGCCTCDADCLDSNTCTTDKCDLITNRCTHTWVSGCVCTGNTGGKKTCDDGNPCTNDNCNVKSKKCTNTAITGCCTTNAQCDDNKYCTLDYCAEDHKCVHAQMTDCCESSADSCDDHDSCTADSCDVSAKTCIHTHITGCAQCTTPTTCPACPDLCTQRTCIAGQCGCSARDPECCTSYADLCDDAVKCTKDSCDVFNKRCRHDFIDHCCYTDKDCIDACACTKDWCDLTTNRCVNNLTLDCCDAEHPCNDGDTCTVDTCNPTTHFCTYTRTPADCCTSFKNCSDGNICTSDICTSGHCSNPAIPDCCKTASDCDDHNSCTTESCDLKTNRCLRAAVTWTCECTVQSDCARLNNPSTCMVGMCARGVCVAVSTCDDGKPNTPDICTPTGTCSHVKPRDAEPVSDGELSDEEERAAACIASAASVVHHPQEAQGWFFDHDLFSCPDWRHDGKYGMSTPLSIPEFLGYLDTMGERIYEDVHCGPFPRDEEHHHEHHPVDEYGPPFQHCPCDDSDPCTIDTCDPSHPRGPCLHIPKNCSDGDECTTDTCNEIGKCDHDRHHCPSDVSSSCIDFECFAGDGLCYADDKGLCHADGDFGHDACFVGRCVDGSWRTEEKNCIDENKCTVDECVSPLGVCIHPPKNCADFHLDTRDYCNTTTGECVHNYQPNCVAYNLCDVATPSGSACSHAALVCNDNNLCTIEDHCNPAVGCVYTEKVCVSDDPCHVAMCDPSDGKCVVLKKTCDDGLLCTNDYCDAQGVCHNDPITCSDSEPCTDDMCNPMTGKCANVWKTCNDHDACTLDYCVAGYGCTNPPLPCLGIQLDPCFVRTCNSSTGDVILSEINCHDQNECTVDTCHHGQCSWNYPEFMDEQCLRVYDEVEAEPRTVPHEDDHHHDDEHEDHDDKRHHHHHHGPGWFPHDWISECRVSECMVFECLNTETGAHAWTPAEVGTPCNLAVDKCDRFACTSEGYCAMKDGEPEECPEENGSKTLIIVLLVVIPVVIAASLAIAFAIATRRGKDEEE